MNRGVRHAARGWPRGLGSDVSRVPDAQSREIHNDLHIKEFERWKRSFKIVTRWC